MKYIWKNKENGITLVALVVTVVILLILAGVSIFALTHNGIFRRVIQAKKENKRAQIVEYLKLKVMDEKTLNPFGNSEDIITATRNNVLKNIGELKRIGKDVTVEETSTEEDGKKVDIYFYVIVDKDVYKVDFNEQKFIGELGNFSPIIELKSISNKTNSIIVEVSTKRNEGGKLEYYIKGEDDKEYKLVKTTTEESYTYDGLIQGIKYSIKIRAISKNGKTAEVTREETTGKIVDLTEENAKFTYNPDIWTNGNVIATLTTELKGYTIQTSLDGKTWSDTESQTVSSNGPVYARLWDGTNAGGMLEGNVTQIDKEAPNVFKVTTKSTVNSIIVKAQTTDKAATETNGESGIEGYRFSKDGGKTWTEYQISGEYTFNDMLKDINGSTYNVAVQAKDKAQNVTTSNVVQASTSRNTNYYIAEANKLLCYVSKNDKTFSREYYKYNKEGAIVSTSYGYVLNNGTSKKQTMIYPLLVSTNKNAVTYYCGENGVKENKSGLKYSSGQIEYKGVKYYYSSDGWWYQVADGFSYTSLVKSLNTSSTPYGQNVSDVLKKSALDLIKKYLGE